MARRRKRSRKSNPGTCGSLLIVCFILYAIISSCSSDRKETTRKQATSTPTETAANIETMIQYILSHDATETQQVILSYTPTPTETPIPSNTPTPTNTFTPVPTRTPWPTRTPFTVSYPVYGQGDTYSYSSGVLGSVQDAPPESYSSNTCRIIGNVNPNKHTYIYHCPNSPYYDQINFNPSQGDRYFCSEEEALTAGFRPPEGDNVPPCGGF